MKLIKFDLPINGIYAKNIEELRDNFTVEILDHYRSGKLAKWLSTRKLTEELNAVQALDDVSERKLLENLCRIFAIEVDEDILDILCMSQTGVKETPISPPEDKSIRLFLPMDGVLIKTREELRDHFTSEIINHYRSGLLAEWLSSRNLPNDLTAVTALKATDHQDLFSQLGKIFGVSTDAKSMTLSLSSQTSDAPEPEPGTQWIEPYTGMVFVWVPGGHYQFDELEWSDRSISSDRQKTYEKYKAGVDVKGFWMGQYPVTQAQWRTIMSGNPQHTPASPYARAETSDIMMFIRLLNTLNTGKFSFRLPILDEWLYAARANRSCLDWRKAILITQNRPSELIWHNGLSRFFLECTGSLSNNFPKDKDLILDMDYTAYNDTLKKGEIMIRKISENASDISCTEFMNIDNPWLLKDMLEKHTIEEEEKSECKIYHTNMELAYYQDQYLCGCCLFSRVYQIYSSGFSERDWNNKITEAYTFQLRLIRSI